MSELILVLAPIPDPSLSEGREKWMCLIVRKSYNRFILFSTGIVFLRKKSVAFAGGCFLPCKGGLRWVLNKKL